MKTANESSATSTAPTSPSARGSKPSANDNKRRPPAPPKPGEPAPKHDEAAFLAQHAVDAKAAISRVLSDLGSDLGQAVHPGYLMRKYPWLTLGASAVAGFAASAALVPSKEDQALKKLAKIERALHPAPPRTKKHTDGEDDESPGDGARGYKSGRKSLGRAILSEVIKAIQPAILSLLTAGVTAKAAKPSEAEMQAAAAAEDAGVPPDN
jgi:hypothetical protein